MSFRDFLKFNLLLFVFVFILVAKTMAGGVEEGVSSVGQNSNTFSQPDWIEQNPPSRFLDEECSFACQKIPTQNSLVRKMDNLQNPQALNDRFSVLVWNIYKGRKVNFPEEFAKLSQKADVKMLQEMFGTESLVQKFLKIPNQSWNLAVSFLMKLDVPTGVMTGSKHESQKTWAFQSPDREPFVKSPKVILATLHPFKNGQNLLALNIHGINFRRDEGLIRQVEQTKEIIAKHNGPVLFAGDFNTKNKGRLAALDCLMRDMDLKRVEWENPTVGPWPAKEQLDHAYVRDLKVNRAHLISEAQGSDHLPLILDLSLQM